MARNRVQFQKGLSEADFKPPPRHKLTKPTLHWGAR